jgi:hypothetical protein
MEAMMSEITIKDAEQAVQLAGVPDADAIRILTAFRPFYEDLVRVMPEVEQVADGDVEGARRERLRLKSIRVGAEKARKMLKDGLLREGRAIDAVNKVLVEVLQPHEQRMDEVEKAEERRLAAERKALHDERFALLGGVCDASAFGDLAAFSAEAFDSLFEAQRLASEARALAAEQERIAAEKAEAERKAVEAAERQRLAEEAERQRVERERLAAERAEQERKAAAERAAIEAERRAAEEAARAERERVEAERAAVRAERERIEREQATRRAEQERAERGRIAAEQAEAERLAAEKRRAQLAPDADKIDAYADALAALRCAECSNGSHLRAEAAVERLVAKLRDFAAELRQ